MKKGEFGQFRKLIRMLKALLGPAPEPPPKLVRDIEELMKIRDPADWWKSTK